MVLTISVNDSKWSDIVKASNEYDFHHTRAYHQLEERNEPVLFVRYFDDKFIALPLVIRKIEGTDLYDCTSVYGYCGPITNFQREEVSLDVANQFKESLLALFAERKIVSAFSRLHPIIDNDILLSDFGRIRELNKTISIDLTMSAEEQRRQYRKSNKSEINQLRGKKRYTVVEASTQEEINTFIDIYYETMKRVDAAEMYFFSHDYFNTFLNNGDFKNKLLLAVKDGEVAAGAIFTIANDIMQYHLAGTREDYIYDTPMKLILDEARLRGNEMGLKYLHLGGGVGGSDEDSLFRFKSGFSKSEYQFRIWQLIADQEKYDQLVEDKDINGINESFFPLYRA